MTGIGQLRDGRSLRDLGTNCLRLLSVVIWQNLPTLMNPLPTDFGKD